MAHVSLENLVELGSDETFEPLELPAPREDDGRLSISASALQECARIAFTKIAYTMPPLQYAAFETILYDPSSSARERFVAASLLENAAIASKGVFPICQDTGTALVYGWRGARTDIEGDSDLERLLATGAREAYALEKLRNSQLGPLTMTEERNTKDNLPAGIQIRAVPGQKLKLLFVAKGGGSTSRASLSMESPAILRPDRLEEALRERIRALGPSGCPPYTIAVVLGGASPSQTLYAAELAALGAFDGLPELGSGDGAPLRDRQWEEIILKVARESGIGAQWGGTHMAVSARAIRLSRHAANLSLAVSISCAANRHIAVIIDREGWKLQKMGHAEGQYESACEEILRNAEHEATAIAIAPSDDSWLKTLRSLPAGSIATLSGPVLIARDAAHARLLRMLETEGKLPEWFLGKPVFYAGPTETKTGFRTGAFGPTTASRMDSYLHPFMGAGASLVTIAKGNRSAVARQAIVRHGGVFCAAIGGAAALNAKRYVRSLRTIAFEDLGMEAIRLADLEAFPVLIAIDSLGNDIYRG